MTKSQMTYETRLRISTTGDDTTTMFTKSGVKLIEGYTRVVIGARGPYVECELAQLNNEVLHEAAERHYYYIELRSVPDDVKVYVQLKNVDYADYVPGLCYVSPFDLYNESGMPLIDRL